MKTKHTCPKCGEKKVFTRYVDKLGNYFADNVGMCNRFSKCKYIYTPGQFFKDNPTYNRNIDTWKESELYKTQYAEPPTRPTDYIPEDILLKSTINKDYKQNDFILFLINTFGEKKATEAAELYLLGSSTNWSYRGINSVVFWQVDINRKIRHCKVMAYNSETGKRLKGNGKSFTLFLGKKVLKNKDANLVQCFFGEHLLSSNPSKPVCIVESEKTAVIMSIIDPSANWIATGGKNGAKWTNKGVYEALRGKDVVLYPDTDAFIQWSEKAKILNTVCRYRVSDYLQSIATGGDLPKGADLADLALIEINQAQCA